MQSYIDTFVFAEAPLSSVQAPLIGSAAYLAVVLSLEHYMRTVRGGRGLDTKWLQVVHNLVLCVGSLVMLVGTAHEVVARVGREAGAPGPFGGARWLFCESLTEARGPLFFWSYV
jgi:hypothetical protein